ncbi:MAG: hypothetical protein KUA35_10325 [Pseudodesulfovibrio sp.]|uniref:Fatty-acid-CoA ligase FadD9 n=1 Tax=Pseudodesulfovibrio aespoeensis (strain ATCC 700646 / DSM 10631 / Aspo-2) TaxID=643562 RepID=E6VUC0_PSEA9|nr:MULTISPECIES: hypothetical protein [Pseudodesulfovibrio]MBU4191360.1 hypothetical protein [Pseudomonadota bacterium]ADU63427.1 fatty-acid-CoA ligase FadD9 [Pseudodesulfovibrio aespoeensis Aspo-2]MBU4243474.1 hypothetical protein [Pseudomonadota bacterium]MBU4380245.1 hypothetical protein [Pseudomonadota bacterium]MBU4473808.1 hypothetical protein [Pseudomonadota bacterium]
MSMFDAMNDILNMTFGELVELGEVSCTIKDGDNPVAVMAVVKGEDACREVLAVIAKYEEAGDDV